ncbi:Cytoplasmic tRNA 2-thiolation protein 1 [Larimichthys crocea]|uniref:Cytoplasmic tRNA 2-thiolation protein 1 n=1 Tax=Larimichthys crocea TaxID=215358 RepID=A0A6G0IML4_LARCR|nr:Cytoplasmic tRNA 2-thiolation protein 1 [Larimichthys crocea]
MKCQSVADVLKDEFTSEKPENHADSATRHARPVQQQLCEEASGAKRPKTGHSLCKDCFFWAFEEGKCIRPSWRRSCSNTGRSWESPPRAEKDSTVLAHVMKLLNERYDYGLELHALGGRGHHRDRDDSLETVKRNQQQYELPLKIVSSRSCTAGRWTPS